MVCAFLTCLKIFAHPQITRIFLGCFKKIFLYFLILQRERERERERERDRFVASLMYAFIGCFLYVPWLEIEPPTLVYQDDSLINWDTWPELKTALKSYFSCLAPNPPRISSYIWCEAGIHFHLFLQIYHISCLI